MSRYSGKTERTDKRSGDEKRGRRTDACAFTVGKKNLLSTNVSTRETVIWKNRQELGLENK